jgi:hypothetical protein
MSIEALTMVHGTYVSTIHFVLHDDLALKRSPQGGSPNFSLMTRCSSTWRPPPPALVTRPGPGRLLLDSAREVRAGKHLLGPEQPQEGVGRGHEKNQRRGVCHRLLAAVRAMPKVYWNHQRLCREMLKNKWPSNFHCCQIVMQFGLDTAFLCIVDYWIFPTLPLCSYV